MSNRRPPPPYSLLLTHYLPSPLRLISAPGIGVAAFTREPLRRGEEWENGRMGEWENRTPDLPLSLSPTLPFSLSPILPLVFPQSQPWCIMWSFARSGIGRCGRCRFLITVM